MFASLDKMLHDDYLCLVESGKQQIKKVRRKFKRKTWKQRQLLSESGFVLRIAPTSLSRDRRIKMKKSINHVSHRFCINLQQRQLLSESGFVLRIAPTSLSRDRRIKMKKSITSRTGSA